MLTTPLLVASSGAVTPPETSTKKETSKASKAFANVRESEHAMFERLASNSPPLTSASQPALEPKEVIMHKELLTHDEITSLVQTKFPLANQEEVSRIIDLFGYKKSAILGAINGVLKGSTNILITLRDFDLI